MNEEYKAPLVEDIHKGMLKDISDDYETIYVHLLNSDDKADFIKTTKNIEKMLVYSLGNSKIIY